MICPITPRDRRDHFWQFDPVHEQMLAPHMHEPVDSHVIWHTSPLHEHVLESVQVRLQPPLGLLQLASQSSVPLQVKVQLLGSAALHENCLGSSAEQPATKNTMNRGRMRMRADRARRVPGVYNQIMLRFAWLLASACGATPPPTTPVTNHGGAPASEPEVWSQPVDGVRARLIATPIANHQTKIEVEIENVSDSDKLEIWFSEPELSVKLQLDGEHGPAIVPGMAVDYASGAPYWLVLPHGCRLRMTLSSAPCRDDPGQPPLFHPVPFQGWVVPIGRLFLRGQFAPPQAPDEKDHAPVFHGPIELPPIELPPR